ncbi:ribonuclease H-like domain-containing protein [Tanacetum coccineum]
MNKLHHTPYFQINPLPSIGSGLEQLDEFDLEEMDLKWTIDGEGVDWTSHSEEEEDYALMACNSSGSDTEAYTQGLKKVEAQLVAHQQGQLWYEEKIRFMKIDLDDKTDVLTYHKKLLAEAQKEKEDLKAKVEKWHTSSKNLHKLLNTQMSANDKFGLGYRDHRYDEPPELVSEPVVNESNVECQPKNFSIFKILTPFYVSQMCDKKNKVLFTDSECLVLSPEFKLPDENQVLLRIPRQNNMYSFNLENIVPSGGLACLIAKATIDESNKWHRRLGHVNFKNLNKLVKGNLVRGLPSKIFQNDHTCVACQKGKQHKAFCKAKSVSSISHALQLLYMDLFGPTSVRSLNHKTYCLVITDYFSRFSWVFFLRAKDETSGIRTKDIIDAGDSEKEDESAQDYFTNGKPVDKEDQVFLDELERLKRQEKDANDAAEALRKEFAQQTEDLLLQAGAAKPSSTNIVNTASTPVSTASPDSDLTNPDQDDSEIPALEEIYKTPTDGIFTNSSYDDEGAVADFTNLETVVNVSPIPTSRINSFHPSTLILGDPQSAVQTRSKVTKSSGAHAFILVDLPYGKKAIGTKWVYRNKKDERGVVVINKARLVAQGHRQEEGIIMFEVLLMWPGLKPLDLLAFALTWALKKSNKNPEKFDFVNVKTASTPIETQKPLVKDEEASDVDVHLYRSMIGHSKDPSHLSVVSRKIIRRLSNFMAWRLILGKQKAYHSGSSNTESEYVAAANATRQNPVYHSKTKHIAIRHHFIRDAYEKKLIQVLKIHTDDNVADLLTKAFDVSRESLGRALDGTEALLLPKLFILWLAKVSTDSAKLIPLGKDSTAIETLKKIPPRV